MSHITVKELVELSGIKQDKGFKEWDGAVPLDQKGRYPFDGRAISVYYDGIFPRIVSYKELSKRTTERLRSNLLENCSHNSVNHIFDTEKLVDMYKQTEFLYELTESPIEKDWANLLHNKIIARYNELEKLN
jgi:hypothetical protein